MPGMCRDAVKVVDAGGGAPQRGTVPTTMDVLALRTQARCLSCASNSISHMLPVLASISIPHACCQMVIMTLKPSEKAKVPPKRMPIPVLVVQLCLVIHKHCNDLCWRSAGQRAARAAAAAAPGRRPAGLLGHAVGPPQLCGHLVRAGRRDRAAGAARCALGFRVSAGRTS